MFDTMSQTALLWTGEAKRLTAGRRDVSTTRIYTLPVEQTGWHVPTGTTTAFSWEYDEGRDRLLSLYEKGKVKQWNASDRIDWSLEVDLGNPMRAPDESVPIFGSRTWEALDEPARGVVRHHLSAWQFSQFLHGEQGALICASKIVQTVPEVDSKFYAATQVMDEARHVEAYSRYLHQKLELAYPINPHLKALLDDVISDRRWDMTYLGMQVLIEGLALAAFGLMRDIGLFGPKIVAAFEDMGVLGYQAVNVDELMQDDERIAEGIDAERRAQVDRTIAAGAD